MQFNVASLLQEITGAYRTYEIDDDVRIGDEVQHLTGEARLDRTQRGVLVRARASGVMHDECSRCLRAITFPVDLEIDEEYIPTIDVNTGAHIDAPEDDVEAYRINARHIIDLNEAVRQYWEIALPMAPVCSEDCAGICAGCGELIAADGHACTADMSDARWSKLANLQL